MTGIEKLAPINIEQPCCSYYLNLAALESVKSQDNNERQYSDSIGPSLVFPRLRELKEQKHGQLDVLEQGRSVSLAMLSLSHGDSIIAGFKRLLGPLSD